jgi:hypothetical protein
MSSATIKLFLVHGDPKRLRIAELSNWTGKAIAGPRSELDGVLAREEAAKPGVYFLSGIDSESGRPAGMSGRPKASAIVYEVTSTRTFGTMLSSSSARTKT